MEIICLNGDFLPAEKAFVSALDQGFLYGFGLFETIFVKGGRPVFLERHLERLFRSAHTLEIPCFFSAAGLARMIEETIRKNKVKNGSLRLTLSAGVGAQAMAGHFPGAQGEKSAAVQATLVIFARRGLPYTPDQYRRGLRAGFVSARKNERSPLVGLKTLNYLENLLAKKEARARGWDEALFLNTAGNLAEGSVSNIFLVREDRVITPALDQGLLPGITRQAVLEKCAALGIEAEERVVSPQEIWQARECFLTNALMGVMPLVEVDGRMIGDGRPGAVTQKLGQVIF